jgi:hypothetical protein
MGDSRRNIIEDLNRLRRIKSEGRWGVVGKACPLYSTPHACVGSKCLWFDSSDSTCGVLNPKPKKAKG